MPVHQRRRLFLDQPIERDLGIAALEGGDHRQGVNHIAQGARLD
jgi:hypothetical protein